MSRLASNRETIELPAVAFTAAQIQNGLEEWSRNLATAKADGDIGATCLATEWLDRWLDRKILAEAPTFLARPAG
jgi:hypothetical protein